MIYVQRRTSSRQQQENASLLYCAQIEHQINTIYFKQVFKLNDPPIGAIWLILILYIFNEQQNNSVWNRRPRIRWHFPKNNCYEIKCISFPCCT